MITLAIIGVVAAITIPGIVINTNQAEYKTGLRKAVSVLNQAITVNKALTGETPYDNDDLYGFLQKSMAVMKSTNVYASALNYAFYTTDGMRYEVYNSDFISGYMYDFKLYENRSVSAKLPMHKYSGFYTNTCSKYPEKCGICGSYGLANNPDMTTEPPCIITVDVNGDRKPSGINTSGTSTHPQNVYKNSYKFADPNGTLMTDVFSIMITDQGAIPYGIVAQKAMYQAQK